MYLAQSPWTTWTRWAGWVWPKLKGEVKTTEKQERRKGNLGWEEQAGQGWDQEKQGETTHPTELQSLSMEIWYAMDATGQTKHQMERSKQLARCALSRTGDPSHRAGAVPLALLQPNQLCVTLQYHPTAHSEKTELIIRWIQSPGGKKGNNMNEP